MNEPKKKRERTRLCLCVYHISFSPFWLDTTIWRTRKSSLFVIRLCLRSLFFFGQFAANRSWQFLTYISDWMWCSCWVGGVGVNFEHSARHSSANDTPRACGIFLQRWFALFCAFDYKIIAVILKFVAPQRLSGNEKERRRREEKNWVQIPTERCAIR